MKKRLCRMIKYTFLFLLCFFGVIYYINFEIPGSTGFIIKKTDVYSSPKKEEITKKFGIGTSITVLGLSNNNMTKIRYIDGEKKKIGFIPTENLKHYNFVAASESSEHSPILMKVTSESTFQDFITEFTNVDVIGVYVESSSRNIDTKSKIERFCEEQHVPFGKMQTFTNENYKSYTSYLSTDDEWKNKYEILPYCFDIRFQNISSKYDFGNCIIYTNSIGKLEKVWLPYKSNIDIENLDESIYAYEFYSDTNISLSYVSDNFLNIVSLAYDNNTATQD